MIVLYLFIILIATMAGATCGMGGGVIIKPLLDACSSYSTFQINFVSSLCVMTMALSSLIKHFIGKTKFFVKTSVFASIGALLGGVCGEYVFDAVKKSAILVLGESADIQIKIVQNIVLAVFLVLILVLMLVKKWNFSYEQSKKRITSVFICCCVLGMISTFLGIGGGPINVCVLCVAMKSNTKEVTTISLLTVFWSQVAKYIKLAFTGGFVSNVIFDMNLMWWTMLIMVVVAIIGGITGAALNKKLPLKIISNVYYIIICSVIALNLINIITNSLALYKIN